MAAGKPGMPPAVGWAPSRAGVVTFDHLPGPTTNAMSSLIDLTQAVRPAPGDELLKLMVGPPPADDVRAAWCREHGIRLEHLPEGVGFELEVIRQATLGWGTQIDAPTHCAAVPGLGTARSVDDVALADLLCNGMVLDLRQACRPGEAISIDALQSAIDVVGRDIQPGDAVLLRTGQERYTPNDPEYGNHPGMTREGTLFLTLRGARVLGTDALTWDRPFTTLKRLYRETLDGSQLWDGHLAIREREAYIVRQLSNLGSLPATGFRVAFLPLKVVGATTAPCRAVASVDD